MYPPPPVVSPEQKHAPYLVKKDALLFDNFILNVKMPESDRCYMSIGDNSMVGGTFLFEHATGKSRSENACILQAAT